MVIVRGDCVKKDGVVYKVMAVPGNPQWETTFRLKQGLTKRVQVDSLDGYEKTPCTGDDATGGRRKKGRTMKKHRKGRRVTRKSFQ
jgi:hypothetical protein